MNLGIVRYLDRYLDLLMGTVLVTSYFAEYNVVISKERGEQFLRVCYDVPFVSTVRSQEDNDRKKRRGKRQSKEEKRNEEWRNPKTTKQRFPTLRVSVATS